MPQANTPGCPAPPMLRTNAGVVHVAAPAWGDGPRTATKAATTSAMAMAAVVVFDRTVPSTAYIVGSSSVLRARAQVRAQHDSLHGELLHPLAGLLDDVEPAG